MSVLSPEATEVIIEYRDLGHLPEDTVTEVMARIALRMYPDDAIKTKREDVRRAVAEVYGIDFETGEIMEPPTSYYQPPTPTDYHQQPQEAHTEPSPTYSYQMPETAYTEAPTAHIEDEEAEDEGDPYAWAHGEKPPYSNITFAQMRALFQAKCSRTEMMLYEMLARFHEDGICWLSQSYAADVLGCPKATVKKEMARLRKRTFNLAGHPVPIIEIAQAGSRGRATTYYDHLYYHANVLRDYP